MSVERNKAAAYETAERLFNQGDLSVVDELMAPDVVDHCEPVGTDGPEHFRQVALMLRSAFPDLHMEIVNIVAEGDLVSAHVRMIGTHQGPFMGIAPTGNRFQTDQMRMMRFHNGKMTDSWAVIDWLGWRQQLGALPQMPTRPPVPA
jgi:predicted ester cyclase